MRVILAAALLVCYTHLARGADEDNPFKKAKVGDWVEYKMTGPNVEGKTKMTVVAKDDKEVAYEVAATFSFMGNETTAPIQKMKVDLTKSYDPVVAANLSRKGVTVEKAGEGEEKIKAGGKELDTKWTKLKTTATVNNVTVVSEYKMWFSPDVPLSGLVRMETATAGIATKLDLIGSGGR